MIIAITLALIFIFAGISEYLRMLVIAQGVRDAVQSSVISTVTENYANVYHGAREGYSGAYQPLFGLFPLQIHQIHYFRKKNVRRLSIQIFVNGQ